MAWRRTEGCCAYPPPRRPSQPHFGWCSSPSPRALAFVQTRRRKSIRAAVCCSNAASSAERAASALQKRSATLWPLVKALVRENRRDIDRKKLTVTLHSKVK